MTVSVVPEDLEVGQGTNAKFTAMAGGISTSEGNFMYQWRKRDSDSLPDKMMGVNGTVLTIPNVTESDEGQYYCTVTNEWSRTVRSSDVTLSIFGMSIKFYKLYLLTL